MVINKIGQQHIDYGTNCQDYGIEFDGMKVVCDGCSEGKHSEVGAKAFCHLLKNDSRIIHECSVYTAAAAFGEILGLFGQTSGSIRDFLCFTILMVTENETHFMVDYCGDGFIVKERLDGTINPKRHHYVLWRKTHRQISNRPRRNRPVGIWRHLSMEIQRAAVDL